MQQNVPREIESDYQRLKQILINILRNSTKFTFKGYIQIGIKHAMMKIIKQDTVVALKDAVQFEFFDTGIGIKEEDQSHLFQLFGRVQQKSKSVNKEGVGLGLYITKKLVDELFGIIELESKQDFFTKFTITLPINRQVSYTQKHLRELEEKGIKFDPKVIKQTKKHSSEKKKANNIQ